MTLSTRIAPHLPYLRRFSRALTGSQASGDAYVAATLEALIADISIFPQVSADRIALYRLFCNLYKTASVQIPEPASAFAWEKQAARNLSHIAPLPRQAFLLVAVEGFNDREAAEILELEDGEFGRILAAASTEISKQVATLIMIIEDEPLIAMDIEQMVESLGMRSWVLHAPKMKRLSFIAKKSRAWFSPTSSLPTAVRVSMQSTKFCRTIPFP